jgi:hypothetical protein
MGASQKDGFPIVFWFVVTIMLVAKYTEFGPSSVWAAAVLWLSGWLGLRLAGHAVARLGAHAWSLLVQLAGWFGLYVWLAPGETGRHIIIVWGIGLPLVIVGALTRRLYDLFPPRGQRFLATLLEDLCRVMPVLVPLVVWWEGEGLLFGFILVAVYLVLPAIPLAYGWRLGAAPAYDERNARFADPDDFHQAGMSDER